MEGKIRISFEGDSDFLGEGITDFKREPPFIRKKQRLKFFWENGRIRILGDHDQGFSGGRAHQFHHHHCFLQPRATIFSFLLRT